MGFEGKKHRFVRKSIAVGLILMSAALAPVAQTGTYAIPIASATTTNAQTIRLPLYPGAAKQNYATIVYGTSTSRYLKAGSARFVVRANLDKVKSWYMPTMTSRGYQLQSSHPDRGWDGPGQQLEFVARHNSGLDVTLDFLNLPNHPQDTVIEYTVVDMEVPARPADSLIASNVTKVLIQYEPASTSGASSMIERTFTKPSMVTALIHAVNALPVDVRDPLYDTAMYKGGATLQFVDSAGHAATVKVEMGVNRVVVGRTAPLFDIKNYLWTLVSQYMGVAPYPPRG